MSVGYYAYAVIGCEIPVNKLYETVTRTHREHPVPHGAAFCPTCGKPVTVEEEIPIFDEDTGTIGDFEVVWSIDEIRAFVGLSCSDSYYYYQPGCIKIENLSDLKERLRNTLTPLDLWDESKFGLYAVLAC